MTQWFPPARLLDEHEERWSPLLRGISLVVEAGIGADERAPVVDALGLAHRFWCGRGRLRDRFFENWAACVVVVLAGVATEHYERGSFWPQLWQRIDLPGGDGTEWGKGFAAAARKLGMPDFPGMRQSYLGPILMHAGIPDYCLDDYFRLIAQRRAAEPGLSAEHFLEWALADEHRLGSLHVPAQRFLTHGTEFARDFVERSFDLLDRLERGEEHLSAVGLPPTVIGKARAAFGRCSDGAKALPVPERPKILLDPFGQGVHVALPATEARAGAAHWYVNVDGQAIPISSQAPWPGPAGAIPATTFAISGPARTVVVTPAGTDHRIVLDVVDPAAPLIIFDERGQRLPTGLPLPPEDVWVLHPDDTELEVVGDLVVRTEAGLPIGWRGWRLRMVSLAKAGSLALAGVAATLRSIRGSVRPRLLCAGPVPGLTTPYGQTVVADPPVLRLPGAPGAQVRWAIEVRMWGTDTPVVSRIETVAGETEITDLWAGVDRPLLGAFEVVVRGPLGRALHEVVFLAEGARTEFEPGTRLFTKAGLAAGKARLAAAEGARFEPETLEFAQEIRDRPAEYHATGRSVPLVVRPPHMAVLYESAEGSGRWTVPVRLETARVLDDAGSLVVRVPGEGHLPPLRMMVSGEIVQELPQSGPVREGTARYDLKKAKDTLVRTGRAELMLDTAGGPVPVATIRPRRLAAGVTHEFEALRLLDPVDGLTAGVYVRHAPWREPMVIRVEDGGLIPLPEELVFAGPLVVHLRIDDSWAPVSWPRWPERFLTAVLPQFENEYPRPEGDVPGRELSKFLVRERSMPQFPGSLCRVWTLYILADELSQGTGGFSLRRECATALRSSPEAALIALGELGLDEADLAASLLGSGLAVAEPLGSRSAPGLWALVPAVAVLLGDLDDEETRVEARRYCGPAGFDELLTTGRDPFARETGFTDEADGLLRMTPEQIDVLRRPDPVPRPVLTAEFRQAAGRQLFLAQNDPAVNALGAAAPSIVDRVRRSLPDPGALRWLDDRVATTGGPGDTAGWRRAPAASAALAMLARRAARGDERCRVAEERYRTAWARFATVAPRLAILDLVVAELLLSR